MNFTFKIDSSYTIDPAGVIALAALAIVCVIVYGVYRIRSLSNPQPQPQLHSMDHIDAQ